MGKMPAPSKLPDVPTLLRLIDSINPDTGKRYTRKEIGQMYGVTHQAVSTRLSGAVESRNYRRDWPWDVEARHKVKWLYLALTYYQTSKKRERPLREAERGTLTRFLSMIEKMGKTDKADYVVDYDPTSAAGFYLRERQAWDDEDSLIGQPEPA